MTSADDRLSQSDAAVLAVRRREKYDSDAGYRERQKAHSRNFRRKRAEQDGLPIKVGGRRHMRPLSVVTADNRQYTCWSVGVLCLTAGVTSDTFCRWERKQVVPAAPVRWKGARYYPEQMIRNIVSVLDAGDRPGRGLERMLYHEVVWDTVGSDCRALWGAEVAKMEAPHEVWLRDQPDHLLAPLWRLWTLDGIADLLDKSVGTVKHWIRWGTLPLSPLRWGEDVVYPHPVVKKMMRGLLTAKPREVSQVLKEAWAEGSLVIPSLSIPTIGGPTDVTTKID